MSKINILDKTISNRIAAGEVVEKPASVVKELVENSLDAGATKIFVQIENGGCKKIVVTDNGSGILREDVERAFLPHATSKIKKIDDLYNIRSLGFRGEALASIAAVSQVLISTRTKDETVGTQFAINGGESEKLEDISFNTGTSIAVSNLFFNTPARQKFLRKPKIEERDITEVIEKFLLSNPAVSFKYTVDDKVVYNTTGSGMLDNIYTIYGKETAENLIEINTKVGDFLLTGFIGKPQIGKQNRTYQTLIINNRIVKNFMISNAISNAFASYLMKGKFPFFVLNLNLPYETVDVNIHPSKQEVKFENANFVYGFFYNTVGNALINASHITSVKDELATQNDKNIKTTNIENYELNTHIKNQELPHLEENEGNSFSSNFGVENMNMAYKNEKNNEANENYFNKINKFETLPEHEIFTVSEAPAPNVNNISSKTSTISFSTPASYLNGHLNSQASISSEINLKSEESRLSNSFLNQGISKEKTDFLWQSNNTEQSSFVGKSPLKIIGTIFNTYIIIENLERIYIIDQHAAHERTIFDEYMRQIENDCLKIQDLMLAYVFDCSNAEFVFFSENLENFRELGFEFEPFGLNKIRVISVPFLVYNVNLEEFINSLKSNIGFFNKKTSEILRDFVAQHACKHAVKAGDILSLSEIEKIVDKLQTQEILLCPHGRPIVIEITKKQIEKWFKRIV